MGELFDRLNERVDPIASPDAKDLDAPFDLRAANTIKLGVRGSERAVQRANRIRESADERYQAELDDYRGGYGGGLDLTEAPKNVTNFLIGDDAAVVGFRWDEEGANFSMNTFKQQWADQPWWDTTLKTLSLATWALPGVGLANKSLKFGKLAKLKPHKSFRFVDPFDGSESFRWTEKFKTVDEEIAFLSDPTKHYVAPFAPGMTKEKLAPGQLSKAHAMVDANQQWNKMETISRAHARGGKVF